MVFRHTIVKIIIYILSPLGNWEEENALAKKLHEKLVQEKG